MQSTTIPWDSSFDATSSTCSFSTPPPSVHHPSTSLQNPIVSADAHHQASFRRYDIDSNRRYHIQVDSLLRRRRSTTHNYFVAHHRIRRRAKGHSLMDAASTSFVAVRYVAVATSSSSSLLEGQILNK